MSDLGKMLDPIADKLLVGALLVTFAWTRDFSAWELIPAIAILMREIFIAGLREFMGSRSVSVPVSFLAKWKTTAQLIALFFVIVDGLLPSFGFISGLLMWIAGGLTILYFAWLRERLDRGEEEVSPPDDVRTVADLIGWLRGRDEAADLAMQRPEIIKAAIDARIVPHD
eukprot:gene67708-92763_t